MRLSTASPLLADREVARRDLETSMSAERLAVEIPVGEIEVGVGDAEVLLEN